MTAEVELSLGTIEYVDSGGDGPVVVLLHGLLMDASLWDGVIAGLAPDHRCIAPTLPLGAHRRQVAELPALTLRSVARLVEEFLERLELEQVTLVGNDTGGALVQLIAAARNARVARIALVSCDAFDNYPPGLTRKTLYVEKCFTQKWHERWLRDGSWKGSNGPVKNRDLWERLFGLAWDGTRVVTFEWIPGHTHIPNNDTVDRLAREAALSAG